MNIVGRTELPITAAVASNYERLHAKFGSFSPKHWVRAVTYKTENF